MRAGEESCHSRRETLPVWPCFLSCLWLLWRQERVIMDNVLGTPEIKESPGGMQKEYVARAMLSFSYWGFLWSPKQKHAFGQTDQVQHSGNQTIQSRCFTFLCVLCQKLNTKKKCVFFWIQYTNLNCWKCHTPTRRVLALFTAFLLQGGCSLVFSIPPILRSPFSQQTGQMAAVFEECSASYLLLALLCWLFWWKTRLKHF